MMNASIDSVDQTMRKTDRLTALRSSCRGVTALNARLEPWMVDVLTHQAQALQAAVKQHGSPLNLLSPIPFVGNACELKAVARRHRLPFRIFFARKANKCLSFVKAAVQSGMGVDVASEQECRQSLDFGASGNDLICTAAVKSASLIRLCVAAGVTIAVDNWDELRRIRSEAHRMGRAAILAIRLSGFEYKGRVLTSRFGFALEEVGDVIDASSNSDGQSRIAIVGLQFHLDGYCAKQRISAICHCLPIVERMRAAGHTVRFLDIGGGLPMCYLENESEWLAFWETHREALLRKREPITYQNHGLGFVPLDGEIYGRANIYPYYQTLVRGTWLDSVLSGGWASGDTLARAISAASLELRCEPGRSLLDGCGITVARVEFCKRRRNGDRYIGLSMNRTQCRTGSDDFLVDPIVIRSTSSRSRTSLAATDSDPVEGYLVGTYCTESDLISLRKLQFPQGIAVGDLVVFPNTAGYLMHFLESRSHRFPLAKNLIVDASDTTRWVADEIDAMEG